MDSAALSRAARDLEGYLLQKVNFYLKVGWLRSSTGDVLIVYYDERELLPKKIVPQAWLGVRVGVQGTLPPGVQPPDPIQWVWLCD